MTTEEMVIMASTMPDGTMQLTVGRWPRDAAFEAAFFGLVDPAYCSRDGSLVTLRAANGMAVYELSELDPYRLVYPARLVSARWVQP